MRPDARVAIVDDDVMVLRLVSKWLTHAGYSATEFATGEGLLGDPSSFDVVCVDLNLEDMSGIELIEQLQARDPELPVVVISSNRDIQVAVAAMRAGAYDYLSKPLDRTQLVHSVNRAAERRALISQMRALESELSQQRVMREIVGASNPMVEVGRHVARVANSDLSVCIFGESGTGKELVARAIHDAGPRASGPFVAVNCAAIPATLQESELFGHERGAFTGAVQRRRGCFEEARHGTLFLDEIGDMAPSAQASVLRTLQERTIRRVGGNDEIEVDVRIVCATHRELSDLVDAGTFRQDLYYRLLVYPIRLPALRERRSDVALLVRHFLHKYVETGSEIPRVEAQALEQLSEYSWPGNVRELENIVRRALLSCTGGLIAVADLPPQLRGDVGRPAVDVADVTALAAPALFDGPDVLPLAELEQRAIEHALRVTAGNVSQAAKMLGIGRATLYRRMAAAGLTD